MNEQIKQHLDEIARWVCKSGSFTYGRDILSLAAPKLSQEEVLEIYAFVKANSDRMETEWRADFLSIFPNSVSFLPEVDPSELWGSRLHSIVEAGDSVVLVDFISEIGADQWHIPGPDFDIYPFEAADDQGELPGAKARRLGHMQIADELEALIQKIKGA